MLDVMCVHERALIASRKTTPAIPKQQGPPQRGRDSATAPPEIEHIARGPDLRRDEPAITSEP
jgi:hypothetical protein